MHGIQQNPSQQPQLPPGTHQGESDHSPSLSAVHRLASFVFGSNAFGEAMTECVVQAAVRAERFVVPTARRAAALATVQIERLPLVGNQLLERKRRLLEAKLDAWVADPSNRGNKAEARGLILEALDFRLARLSLAHLRLTTLPPGLEMLADLRILDLSSNRLTALPPEIVQLALLEQIDLANNELSSLPPQIRALGNLRSLFVQGNLLTSLPSWSWIGGLANLRYFNLRRNQLRTLPSWIGELTLLESLDLHGNKLTSLPPQIARLTHLERVFLGENQFTALPSIVRQLPLLHRLDLRGNRLTDLPPWIAELTHLTNLCLDNNLFREFPPQIGGLTDLKILSLQNNQLRELPPEIGGLTRLDQLYLDHNQFMALSPEIGDLVDLRVLSFEYNPELSELPMTLGQIPGLVYFSIEGTGISEEMRTAILNAASARRAERAVLAFPEKLQMWLAASRGSSNLSGVERFSEDEKRTLHEWLVRLERTRDFGGSAQVIMARAVCEMLLESTTNAAFKAALLTQADANNENCEDRAAIALNELYTFLKLTKLDERATLEEQLAILGQAARTIALRKAVAERIVARQEETGRMEREAVEVYLFCETRLKERLGLLTIISTMAYEQLGNVDWISLSDLEEEVHRTYLDHLVALPAFDRVAGERYKEGRDAEYDALHARLEAVDPNLPGGERRQIQEEIGREWKALELHHKKEWVLARLRG